MTVTIALLLKFTPSSSAARTLGIAKSPGAAREAQAAGITQLKRFRVDYSKAGIDTGQLLRLQSSCHSCGPEVCL